MNYYQWCIWALSSRHVHQSKQKVKVLRTSTSSINFIMPTHYRIKGSLPPCSSFYISKSHHNKIAISCRVSYEMFGYRDNTLLWMTAPNFMPGHMRCPERSLWYLTVKIGGRWISGTVITNISTQKIDRLLCGCLATAIHFILSKLSIIMWLGSEPAIHYRSIVPHGYSWQSKCVLVHLLRKTGTPSANWCSYIVKIRLKQFCSLCV